MSTTYEIYKFAKPTLKELSIVDYYSDYDVFSILDEDVLEESRENKPSYQKQEYRYNRGDDTISSLNNKKKGTNC